MNDDFDFGFTTVDSATVAKDSQKDKIKKMYTLVSNLLDNLAKNPEKDTIYWPNRVEKIDQFRKKLDAFLDE